MKKKLKSIFSFLFPRKQNNLVKEKPSNHNWQDVSMEEYMIDEDLPVKSLQKPETTIF